MRSEQLNKNAAHELEVIDAVVRGGGEARPEDTELVDFALLMRSVRPLPDHGAQSRIDERVAAASVGQRVRSYPTRQLAAAFACLILVAGVIAVDRVNQHGEDQKLETSEQAKRAPVESARGLSSAEKQFADDTAKKLAVPEVESAATTVAPVPEPGGAVPGRARKQEKTALISLVTPPEKFDRASDRITAIAAAAGGYVQVANTRVSDRARARGTFLLMIPVAQYRASMGKLARLGHVRSQSEGVQDITAEYASAERTLKSRRSRTEQLEDKLKQTTDETERARIQRQLRRAELAERQAAQRARSTRFRTNYVPVDVRLAASVDAEAAEQGAIAKAFDRAGEILENLFAALIVVLAVVMPVAAIVAVGWWIVRRWRRGRANRALAEAATQPE